MLGSLGCLFSPMSDFITNVKTLPGKIWTHRMCLDFRPLKLGVSACIGLSCFLFLIFFGSKPWICSPSPSESGKRVRLVVQILNGRTSLGVLISIEEGIRDPSFYRSLNSSRFICRSFKQCII